uniref:Reverse transcriptase (RNA-dependent DNA polymerase) n=1 Tax=Candidatus Kentrum sp. TC TaxID=2126339 RepID=A0A451AHD0_9GAMM|nr:MAG: hypothetical protein BECKTC1821F_GA0114240_11901 [Candidatus Kentron sp. TC]
MRIRSSFDPSAAVIWRWSGYWGFGNKGGQVVLDADIQGFFDNIPHEVIMSALADVVADGNILGLVERFLRAKNMDN